MWLDRWDLNHNELPEEWIVSGIQCPHLNMSRGADAEFPSRTYQPRFIMIQLVPLSWIVMDCHGLQCELTRLKPRVNHGNSCGRIWCQSGRSRAKWWCSLALGSGIRTRLRRRFAEDWQCALGLPHKFGCNLQIFEPTAAINHRSTAQCWLNRRANIESASSTAPSFINIVH